MCRRRRYSAGSETEIRWEVIAPGSLLYSSCHFVHEELQSLGFLDFFLFYDIKGSLRDVNIHAGIVNPFQTCSSTRMLPLSEPRQKRFKMPPLKIQSRQGSILNKYVIASFLIYRQVMEYNNAGFNLWKKWRKFFFKIVSQLVTYPS